MFFSNFMESLENVEWLEENENTPNLVSRDKYS